MFLLSGIQNIFFFLFVVFMVALAAQNAHCLSPLPPLYTLSWTLEELSCSIWVQPANRLSLSNGFLFVGRVRLGNLTRKWIWAWVRPRALITWINPNLYCIKGIYKLYNYIYRYKEIPITLSNSTSPAQPDITLQK